MGLIVGSYGSVEVDVTALTAEVASLSASLSANTAVDTTQTANIAALASGLSANDATDASQSAAIAALSSGLSANNATDTAQDASIAALAAAAVPLATTAPPAIGASNVVGTGTKSARDDHAHAHGAQTDGTMHAAATGSVSGFMTGAQFTKLAGIATGADVTVTALAAASAAISVNNQRVTSVGTPTGASDAATKGYADGLVIPLASTAPATVAAANAVGVGTTSARADHAHAHGAQTDGTMHAAATGSVAGFMTAAQFTQLASLAAGQSATLGTITVDGVRETPTTLSGTGTVSVASDTKNDFLIVLTGTTTLSFDTFASGKQGTIWVKQDATGNRALSFSAPGATTVKDTLLADLNPAQTANSLTMYTYAMFTLGGTDYLQLTKSFLS